MLWLLTIFQSFLVSVRVVQCVVTPKSVLGCDFNLIEPIYVHNTYTSYILFINQSNNGEHGKLSCCDFVLNIFTVDNTSAIH